MKKGSILNFSILLVFLSSCSFIQSSDGSTTSSSSSSIVSSTNIEYGLDDANTDYSGNIITLITMNGNEVAIDGNGAAFTNGNIEITKSGVYYFNGTLDNGQVIIESNDENTVWLVFDGIDITYESGAPIFVKEAEKTIITLKEGSDNYLKDGENYVLNEDEEPTATLFSKDDLIINGSGSLNISANYNDGYSILFEYDNEVYVSADESKISQVFYNLLINAINYSHENKEIIVKQKTFENEVRVDVIDNGEGIDKEDLSKIWDRYYKVDKNHKRSFSGSGIGLSIVKSIMTLHKTKYGVDSEKDKGSDFWFYLKKSQ